MFRNDATIFGLVPAMKLITHHGSRLALCLAIVTVAALPALAADETELLLASDIWPPFTDQDGKHRVAIEIAHTALERAGIQAATTVVDWKDVERGIQRGSFDGSAAMWRSIQREREFLFSDPYLENRLVLIGRKGTDVRATQFRTSAARGWRWSVTTPTARRSTRPKACSL